MIKNIYTKSLEGEQAVMVKEIYSMDGPGDEVIDRYEVQYLMMVGDGPKTQATFGPTEKQLAVAYCDGFARGKER